jgi:Uma2 family endonuclease
MRTGFPRHQYTLADYLDVEETSAVRHEYFGGDIFAMAGGTPEHAALCSALIGALAPQLRGTSCRSFTSDLRIAIAATGLYTYPDVAIVCGQLARDPASPTHVTNPRVLFEVLSPATQDYDRGAKREHSQQIESLAIYVVLAQDRRHVEAWHRRADGTWAHETRRAGETLELPAVGCRLDIDQLYADAGLALP